MRIYDNRTPDGRKVDKPAKMICSLCEGVDGRHGLATVKEAVQDKDGRNRTRTVTKPCPRGN